MSHSAESIILFTKQFPYGNGETFLENELPLLCDHFNEVHIFPFESTGSKRAVPENCSIHKLDLGFTSNLKRLIPSNIGLILKILFKDLSSRQNRRSLLTPKLYLTHIIRLIYECDQLKKYLFRHNLTQSILYTYWLHDWTTILSAIKYHHAELYIVSRAHGYDFNLNRNPKGYYWFRPFVLSQVSKIFNVSHFGTEYLKDLYSKYTSKFHCSYLGVSDQNTISSNDNITIVSCSNVIPLKRVENIPEILNKLDTKIHWVHFGDGDHMPVVQVYCKTLRENISYELLGQKSNADVISFYKNNPVSVFLHLSETEGLPVSMMEAQSFGIPIIACDTGGVKEIVNSQTGALVPVEYNISEVAQHIKNWMDADNSARVSIQEFQKKHFSARKNYTDFINKIIQIDD